MDESGQCLPLLRGDIPKIAVSVLATDGTELAPKIDFAARTHGIEAMLLAALCKAESDLTINAERWGNRTAEAKECLRVLGLL